MIISKRRKHQFNFASIFSFTLDLKMFKLFEENQHFYFNNAFNQLLTQLLGILPILY